MLRRTGCWCNSPDTKQLPYKRTSKPHVRFGDLFLLNVFQKPGSSTIVGIGAVHLFSFMFQLDNLIVITDRKRFDFCIIERQLISAVTGIGNGRSCSTNRSRRACE